MTWFLLITSIIGIIISALNQNWYAVVGWATASMGWGCLLIEEHIHRNIQEMLDTLSEAYVHKSGG